MLTNLVTAQDLAKQIGLHPSSTLRMLRNRKDIERIRMIQRPSGQTVVCVTAEDAKRIIEEYTEGLHPIPAAESQK